MNGTVLKSAAGLVLCAAALASAPAAVDLTFETGDTNVLGNPTFSGSTINITADSLTYSTTQFNTIMNPVDGTPGVQSAEITFTFGTDIPTISGAPGSFVRVTDADPTGRHLLSARAPSGGIGIYFLYDGSAGPVKMALSVREEPVDTGGNETYEQTDWITVTGDSEWQHAYWSFATDMATELATASAGFQDNESWPMQIAFGDGIYDGDVGEATAFEAILFVPIPGSTSTSGPFMIRVDDIYTGTEHDPLFPASASNWHLLE